MSGAISLTGIAALRSGAGLVTIVAPGPCVPTIAMHEPSYKTKPVPMENQYGTIGYASKNPVLRFCFNTDCVGIGPGLGCNQQTQSFVNDLYAELPIPLVVDADALNCLAAEKTPLRANASRILTPHPGELRRLINDEEASVEACRAAAVQLAAENECVIVAKGHDTFITDGTRSATNKTGNAGLATGGTGDVLTGVITALVGQGMGPFEAARLGVHLHGLAGDLAAKKLGEHSLIASDLPRFLPKAFRMHARQAGAAES
jgi:NAD(P)H-hydrate epimerase